MTFAEHQADTAQRLGYGDDVEAMNRDHDPLHRALCAWLGVPSLAMRMAAGLDLTEAEAALAALEEDAVLAVQRFKRAAASQ